MRYRTKKPVARAAFRIAHSGINAVRKASGELLRDVVTTTSGDGVVGCNCNLSRPHDHVDLVRVRPASGGRNSRGLLDEPWVKMSVLPKKISVV